MDNIKTQMMITRKYVIKPTFSDTKEWNKKVFDFTVNDLTKKIEKSKDKEKKKQLMNELERLEQTNEFTQKMVNNYTYSLVRDSMESEARRKNYILSWMFSTMIENGVQYMNKKEQNKFISEMLKPCFRVKGSKKGSLFDNIEIENILNGYGISFSQALTNKIKDAVKDGLLNGKVSLPSYKIDSPFTIAKTTMGFTHEYDSIEELKWHIKDKNCKLYFDFGGNQKPTIARFIIDTGRNKNRDELLSTLLKVYSGEYEYCGSSIQLDKNGKKIILNLSMKIPCKELELDENTVVGVDLGLAIPAVCSLNNNDYIKQSIGSKDDFLRIRTQLQAQRRRLQKSLTSTSGGHGRKKKLKPLEKLSDRERNFVKTYNHYVSKNVVDFAIKNKAKYINLENLVGYDTNQFILRNWSFYELQQFITYKAQKYGIEVRKINPCYTSQICSCCGHWEEGQRIDQAHFKCKVCGAELNADFNASRNIAKSTLWCDEKITEKHKQEAREYYKIEKEVN